MLTDHFPQTGLFYTGMHSWTSIFFSHSGLTVVNSMTKYCPPVRVTINPPGLSSDTQQTAHPTPLPGRTQSSTASRPWPKHPKPARERASCKGPRSSESCLRLPRSQKRNQILQLFSEKPPSSDSGSCSWPLGEHMTQARPIRASFPPAIVIGLKIDACPRPDQ